VSARAVALRGRRPSSAISPKYSPGPSVPTTRGSVPRRFQDLDTAGEDLGYPAVSKPKASWTVFRSRVFALGPSTRTSPDLAHERSCICPYENAATFPADAVAAPGGDAMSQSPWADASRATALHDCAFPHHRARLRLFPAGDATRRGTTWCERAVHIPLSSYAREVHLSLPLSSTARAAFLPQLAVTGRRRN
jgi:hypothetical protein